MRHRETVAKYEEWWLHKYCRLACDSDGEFKRVTRVEWVGPPSGVYGCVELTFEDGTLAVVDYPYGGFRPRKKDVIIRKD
jgi:hypothetical protein